MTYERMTSETKITLDLTDNASDFNIKGLSPFLMHLVTILFFYSAFGGRILIEHDGLEDEHHAFEDLGISLGTLLNQVKASRSPLIRFSTQYRPMDEALVRVSIDLSGRCGFYSTWLVAKPQDVQTETLDEFYKALCRTLNCSLHLDVLKGENRHHIHEAAFKALGAALKQAFLPSSLLISTKGVLDT